jgi:hypothetical protein
MATSRFTSQTIPVPYSGRNIGPVETFIPQSFGNGGVGAVPAPSVASAPAGPPQPEYTATVRQTYPSASLADDWGTYTANFITGQGYLPSNTLYAVGICSDDVDAFAVAGNIGQFPTTMNPFLGPFNSGGLAGYPFVGSVGLNAFASHITYATSGSLLITSTPHIGITIDGQVGYQYRLGQDPAPAAPSTNCGAVHGVVGWISTSGGNPPTQSVAPFNNGNYEFWELTNVVFPFSSSLSGSLSQNVAYATSIISSASFAYIYANSASYHDAATGSNVFVIGGTFINTDYTYQAYTEINQCWKYTAIGSGSWTNLTATYCDGLFNL